MAHMDLLFFSSGSLNTFSQQKNNWSCFFPLKNLPCLGEDPCNTLGYKETLELAQTGMLIFRKARGRAGGFGRSGGDVLVFKKCGYWRFF